MFNNNKNNGRKDRSSTLHRPEDEHRYNIVMMKQKKWNIQT